MSLVERIVREHLEKENGTPTRREEAAEVKRLESINALPLEEFRELPEEDQELAEELWTAKVMEANVRRLEQRRERIVREEELDGADG